MQRFSLSFFVCGFCRNNYTLFFLFILCLNDFRLLLNKPLNLFLSAGATKWIFDWFFHSYFTWNILMWLRATGTMSLCRLWQPAISTRGQQCLQEIETWKEVGRWWDGLSQSGHGHVHRSWSTWSCSSLGLLEASQALRRGSEEGCCWGGNTARSPANRHCTFRCGRRPQSHYPPHLQQRHFLSGASLLCGSAQVRTEQGAVTLTVYEVHVLACLSLLQFVGGHPQLHNQLPGPHVRPGDVHLHLRVVDLAHQSIAGHLGEVPGRAEPVSHGTETDQTAIRLFNTCKKLNVAHVAQAVQYARQIACVRARVCVSHPLRKVEVLTMTELEWFVNIWEKWWYFVCVKSTRSLSWSHTFFFVILFKIPVLVLIDLGARFTL